MGKQVPKTSTPVSDAQMSQAISNVWQRLFGTPASPEQVHIIMAQNAIETGRNRKSMHNYNVGNIIVGTTNHDYFLGGDWMYADKAQTVKKPITQKFRAYNSLEEGVQDYLNLLSKSKRYANAWQHIMNPNIRAYSKALHDAGYYGAKEEEYTKGLLAQYNSFSKTKVPSANPSQQAQPTQVAQQSDFSNLDNIMKKYLQQMGFQAAANTTYELKKIYNSHLPTHDILIRISAPDYASAIEFAGILSTALDEDLLTTSYLHTDGHDVEIECSIAGPEKTCFDAVQQMADAVSETFKDATAKIGGVSVKTQQIMNKKSSYQPISPRTADTNHRKFLLKFI